MLKVMLDSWTEIESTKEVSKEVLWVSVGQRAAELRDVKLEGKKKICHSAWFEPS